MKRHKVLAVFAFIILFLWISPALALKVTIARLKGSVLVHLPDQDRWIPARCWMDLPEGAEIRTLEDSFADLLFAKKALVRIKENSQVRLEELEDEVRKIFKGRASARGTLIRLRTGCVYLLVRPDYPEKPFVVETPIGMAGVTGTRFVVHLVNEEEMLVAVWKGEVKVWDPWRHRLIPVRTGKYCLLARTRAPELKPISPEVKESYKEVEKLLLPEDINWKLRSPGSRYEGTFTRGFAPDRDLEEKEAPSFWEFRVSKPTTGTKTPTSGTRMPTTTSTPDPSPSTTSTSAPSAPMTPAAPSSPSMTYGPSVPQPRTMPERSTMPSDSTMMERTPQTERLPVHESPSTMMTEPSMHEPTMHELPLQETPHLPENMEPSMHEPPSREVPALPDTMDRRIEREPIPDSPMMEERSKSAPRPLDSHPRTRK